MPGYSIKVARTSEDIARVMDLNEIVHSDGIGDIVDMTLRNPLFKPEYTRYIELDGQVVSTVSIFPTRLRLGGEEMKTGEIGIVGTHPDYRHRGLSSALMWNAIEFMEKQGYHASFLYGIPNFYQQFGYEYAVPCHIGYSIYYSYLPVNNIKDLKSSYTLRNLCSKDIEQVSRIYDKNNVDRNCSQIISLGEWEYRTRDRDNWFVAEDRERVIRGYFRVLKDNRLMKLIEVGVADEEAIKGILIHISPWAEKKDVLNIAIFAPQDHPFTEFCYRIGAWNRCTNEIYNGSWGGMFRIIDLKETLKLLEDKFGERLTYSHLKDYEGELRIVTEYDRVKLSIKRGVATVEELSNLEEEIINLPNSVITQLTFGYRDIDYFRNSLDIEASHRNLLKILFPKGYPYIWLAAR